MARFGKQVPENYGDGGEAAGVSSFEAGAEGDAMGTTADQTAHHDSVHAQSGGATSSSSIWNLRGRNGLKVEAETGADSDQEDLLRIVSSRSLSFQGGASVEEVEQQGGTDEEDSLKFNVKKLNGTVEQLQRVVQVQTGEIGDLKSLVLTQSKQIETQSKQIETLLATVDDLKELVSHRSSISQHEEPLVEASDCSDDANPPSSFPSDHEQGESSGNVSGDGTEGRKLVQRRRTRECYVSLKRRDPVLSSMRSSAATSTSQDEMNSSSAEICDGSHEEEKKLKRRQHEVCKNGLKNVRYKCKVCSLGFLHKSHYNRHMVKHSNARPFACPQCQTRFKSKGHVTRHVKEVHFGKKTLRCPHCSKTFGRRPNLVRHLRIHSERPYLCEKCSRTFKDNGDLAAHMRRTHPSESV